MSSSVSALDRARALIGRQVEEIQTPALLVDVDALDRNLAVMAEDCRRLGVDLRPHVKSHKSPIVARRQIELGAIGVTAAKVSEAEAMVDGGINNILVSTVVGSRAKAARLADLATRTDVIAVVDSLAGVQYLADEARRTGVRVDVLVDVNVGQDRTGADPGNVAVLAQNIAGTPHLRVRGLQGYEGHLQHKYGEQDRAMASSEAMGLLSEAVLSVRSLGLPVDIVTTAGTGTYRLAASRSDVTEVQPGSYVFMDCDYARVEGLSFDSALTVLTTVVGNYPDRAIVDAGSKSISTDAGQPQLKASEGVKFQTAGDEHGKLTRLEGYSGVLPSVGSVVELVPSHCDTTVNLYDFYHLIRSGVVEDVWPVAARGRSQ